MIMRIYSSMKKILGIILRITFFLPILLQVSFCIFQLLLCSRLKCMFKVIFAKLMHFSFKLWPVRVEKNFKCFFTYRNLAKLLEWSLRAVSMDFSGIFSASVTLLASAAEESIDTVVSETAKDAAEDTIPTPPLKEVVGDVAALALVVPAMSALTTSVLENSPGVSGYFAGFLVIGSIFTALALASPVVGFSAIVGTTTTVALKVFGLTSAATALKAGVAASTVTMLACRFGEALPAETDIPREFASLDSIITRHAREKQDITITSFSDSNDDFPSQPGSVTLESIIRAKRSMKPAALVHPTTIDEPISISMARAEPLSENVIISSGDNNNDDDSSGGVVNINSSSREPLSENVIISSGDNNNDDDSSGGAVNINSSSTKPLEEDAHAQLPQEALLIIPQVEQEILSSASVANFIKFPEDFKPTVEEYDIIVSELRAAAEQQIADSYKEIEEFVREEEISLNKALDIHIATTKAAMKAFAKKIKCAQTKAHEERLAAKARGDLDYDSDSESYYDNPFEVSFNIKKADAILAVLNELLRKKEEALADLKAIQLEYEYEADLRAKTIKYEVEKCIASLPEPIEEISFFSRDSTTTPKADNEDLF